MMRRIAVALVLVGALGSSFANALGLGELKLNSALNQKFDAEIKLLNVGDLSKNEILPNLASHEDFSRAGVERVFFLTSMKFKVRFDTEGNAFVQVSTDKIVREPFLNFLVELHWPSGRILREYTVLLDPPIFSEAPASRVQQAVSKPQPPSQSEQPAKKKVEKSVSRPSVAGSRSPTSQTPRSSAGSDGGSVRVKKNDTLWGIAKKNRPGAEVTIRQTMLAIQRHNPQAFIRNNINLLKAGQLLKIPNVEQIRELSNSEVSQEIARQNDEWRDRTIDATQKEEPLPRIEPQEEVVKAEEEFQSPGQLKLLTDDTAESTEELASNASGASLEADTEEVAPTETGVTALPSETADDSSEIAEVAEESSEAVLSDASTPVVTAAQMEDLQSQIDDLKRLLSLKDQKLALLQANAANPSTGANAPTSPEVQPSKPAEPGNEQGLIATLLNKPIYIALIILAILVGLVILGALSRRRNEEQDYPEDLQEAISSAQTDVDLPEDLESELEVDETIEPVEKPSDDELVAQQKAAGIRKLIEEADIYIAYGRYERALEMLQPAVNENPSAWPLRLKLVEIFVAMGDEAGLSQQEADLQAIGNEEALEKLAALKALAEGDETQAESNDDLIEFELGEDDNVVAVDSEVEQFETIDVDEDFVDEADADAMAAGDLESDVGDMDFLGDTDETATKLELGRAYIDMADNDAATDILNEVVADGSEEQKEEARKLLDSIA